MVSYASILTPDQIQRAHAASLELLENVGLLVRNEKARNTFEKNSCWVDPGTQIVKFPSAVVEKYRALIPPEFTFFGRDQDHP